MCGADKLLLLTDQKGLFTADPRKDPNAARASGGTNTDALVTTRPPRRISPPSGRSIPATTRSIVVLPHPDWPSRQTVSPAATASDTSSRASVVANLWLTLSICSALAPGFGPSAGPATRSTSFKLHSPCASKSSSKEYPARVKQTHQFCALVRTSALEYRQAYRSIARSAYRTFWVADATPCAGSGPSIMSSRALGRPA